MIISHWLWVVSTITLKKKKKKKMRVRCSQAFCLLSKHNTLQQEFYTEKNYVNSSIRQMTLMSSVSYKVSSLTSTMVQSVASVFLLRVAFSGKFRQRALFRSRVLHVIDHCHYRTAAESEIKVPGPTGRPNLEDVSIT